MPNGNDFSIPAVLLVLIEVAKLADAIIII
jgi:hypothetical protein